MARSWFTKKQTQDVAVVGASAAGLFTARLLAEKGAAVRVFEAAESLNSTPRVLIVTRRMRDIIGSVAATAVVNEIRRFELFTDGRDVQVVLKEPDLVVERAALIRQLAAEAAEAGAQILLSRRLRAIESTQTGLSLVIEGSRGGEVDHLPSRTLVGADGTFSKVARAGGWPSPVTLPLVQAKVRLPAGLSSDTARVWFVPADTPYFYWLIPESREYGVLGLIGEEGPRTRRCLAKFLDKQGLTPVAFQAARIPFYTGRASIHRQIGGTDVYLVGDAGGHVKVTTVGGLVTGFRAARAVAEMILSGGRRDLHALRRELDLHLLVRRCIHEFTQADYSQLFDLLNVAAWGVLSAHSRDDIHRVLVRLCMTQPKLLLLGLRRALSVGALAPRIAGRYSSHPADVNVRELDSFQPDGEERR